MSRQIEARLRKIREDAPRKLTAPQVDLIHEALELTGGAPTKGEFQSWNADHRRESRTIMHGAISERIHLARVRGLDIALARLDSGVRL